jgi:DNA-binding NarL/FixJ family response regulator
MTPIGVLLVDDNPKFLSAMSRVLSTEACVQIIGVALCGADALEMMASLECDLVLLDVNMPNMNGLEVAQRLRNLPTPPRIVLLSLNDLGPYRQAAATCADAYLDKSQAATHLLPLIRSLFDDVATPVT